MHAYIITGTDSDAIEEKIQTLKHEWNVSPFDIITIEKEEEKKEISIQQIREMSKQLFLTPTHGAFTVAMIKEAHRMTIAAQNALLKILEEPPEKVKLLLISTMPDMLLQTISSRCEKCQVLSAKKSTSDHSLTLDALFSFEQESISGMLTNIDKISLTSQGARDYIDEALAVLHTAISTGNTTPYGPEKCSKLAKILLKTRSQLLSNVNQKLALDSAFLEARQG